MKPKSFEILIKKLLIAMGYGKTTDDVVVTQYVGDNGIDGYVRKDRLDIEKLCAYQAKRYTTTNVGITEMNALGGSMINCGTNCGIFVTTTDFTSSAKNYNPRGYTIIRLDGKSLVGYLIEYGIGVKTEEIEVKTVDIDFLNSL
jgi:restriction system protein